MDEKNQNIEHALTQLMLKQKLKGELLEGELRLMLEQIYDSGKCDGRIEMIRQEIKDAKRLKNG